MAFPLLIAEVKRLVCFEITLPRSSRGILGCLLATDKRAYLFRRLLFAWHENGLKKDKSCNFSVCRAVVGCMFRSETIVNLGR